MPTRLTSEDFTTSNSTARSVVLVQDASGAPVMRVTHDFHPARGPTNLYEVSVTVENLTGEPVQPSYARALTWASGLTFANLVAAPGTPPVDPTSGGLVSQDAGGVSFLLGLPVLQPGDAQEFRLYLGAGTTLGEATAGLANNGASVLSQAAGGSHASCSAARRGRRRAPRRGGADGGGGSGTGSGGGTRGGSMTGGGDTSGSMTGGGGAGCGGSAGNNIDGGSTGGASPQTNPQTTQPDVRNGMPGPLSDFAPGPPSAQATPELDAFLLFCAGLAGMGGHALRHARAGRKSQQDQGEP